MRCFFLTIAANNPVQNEIPLQTDKTGTHIDAGNSPVYDCIGANAITDTIHMSPYISMSPAPAQHNLIANEMNIDGDAPLPPNKRASLYEVPVSFPHNTQPTIPHTVSETVSNCDDIDDDIHAS